jgi:photosystem II stability/assembly factor-like uncharacterized protein
MAATDQGDADLRRSFEAVVMPTDTPIAFDADRWRHTTAPRAARMVRAVRQLKRMVFAVVSTAAAAAVFALPALAGRPQAATEPPVPTWSGKGPLASVRMVSPKVGWAMTQFGPPNLILHTTTGPRGFKAVFTYPVPPGVSYGTTWHVFSGMASILVLNNLVPHTLVVERTTDGGAHWRDTRIVLPKRDGQWFLGQWSWWNTQDGIMAVYLVKKDRERVWLGPRAVAYYRTTTGGRRWSPVRFDIGRRAPQDLGILALTGHRTVIAGTSTTLWRSTDQGRTFAKVALPAPPGGGAPRLLGGGSVAFPDGGRTGVLLAEAGSAAVAYVTTDGGSRWRVSQEFPDTPDPLLATAGGSWWVTAGTGEIWATVDSGARWLPIGVPALFTALMKQKYLLQREYFASATVGYAIWETSFVDEKIVMTSDGGRTWSVVWSYSPLGNPGP